MNGQAIEIDSAEQLLLCRSAGKFKRMTLAQAQFGIEFLFNAAGEGEIEVFSTEQEVVSNCRPLEFNVIPLHACPHKAEIRSAATDVADENQVTIPNVVGDGVLMRGHPCIKSSE